MTGIYDGEQGEHPHPPLMSGVTKRDSVSGFGDDLPPLPRTDEARALALLDLLLYCWRTPNAGGVGYEDLVNLRSALHAQADEIDRLRATIHKNWATIAALLAVPDELAKVWVAADVPMGPIDCSNWVKARMAAVVGGES